MRVGVSSTCACPRDPFKFWVRLREVFQNQRGGSKFQLTSISHWLLKDGTKKEDHSLQWLVMSESMKPDLLRLFGNKGLKVTDKQCGLSVCQCVFVYFQPSLSECDFFWGLVHGACKSLLSGRNDSVLGFYGQLEQSLYSWESDRKKERERKRQTVQQTRQRQIYGYYLITINIIHCRRRTSYSRNEAFWGGWLKLVQLKSVSELLRDVLIVQVYLLNRDLDQTRDALGLQCCFTMQMNSVYYPNFSPSGHLRSF